MGVWGSVIGWYPFYANSLENIGIVLVLKSIRPHFKSNSRYGFEVTILAKNKSYYKFQWVVEKYYEEGVLKDCWLTTSVSSPVSLGSSI